MTEEQIGGMNEMFYVFNRLTRTMQKMNGNRVNKENVLKHPLFFPVTKEMYDKNLKYINYESR